MSKLTDYGIVVMTYLAQRRERVYNAPEVAESVRLSLPTVSKLLKTLARAGLVMSQRGVTGGYRLAREPGQISVAQIIDALEGPVAITECSSASGNCLQEPYCALSGNWQKINHVVRSALGQVSLAEMAQPIPVDFPAAAAGRPGEGVDVDTRGIP